MVKWICVLSIVTMMNVAIGAPLFAEEKPNTKIDLSKATVVMPFESSVTKASASMLCDAMQESMIAHLKEAALFSVVLTPEEAKDKDKATLIEISGKLRAVSSLNFRVIYIKTKDLSLIAGI